MLMNVKRSLTDLILLSLEKTVGGYVRVQDYTYNSHLYLYGYPRELKKSTVSQALKRLREGGFIEFIRDEDLIMRLTDKGYDRAVWSKILEESEWDGRWRLVSFDIPEKRRVARDLLRSKLKQLGFTRWQKSLWVSKKDCTQVLRKFINQVGIQDWVMVIESDNVGR